jgi:hypothetical protein
MERKSTALKAGRIKIMVFILQVQAFKIIVLRLKKKSQICLSFIALKKFGYFPQIILTDEPSMNINGFWALGKDQLFLFNKICSRNENQQRKNIRKCIYSLIINFFI